MMITGLKLLTMSAGRVDVYLDCHKLGTVFGRSVFIARILGTEKEQPVKSLDEGAIWLAHQYIDKLTAERKYAMKALKAFKKSHASNRAPVIEATASVMAFVVAKLISLLISALS